MNFDSFAAGTHWAEQIAKIAAHKVARNHCYMWMAIAAVGLFGSVLWWDAGSWVGIALWAFIGAMNVLRAHKEKKAIERTSKELARWLAERPEAFAAVKIINASNEALNKGGTE